MKEFSIKIFFGIGLLCVLFLWSGGIYKDVTLQGTPARINKITGTFEVISEKGWIDIKDF